MHSARLPPEFLQFYAKIPELDRELSLPLETVDLTRAQVARINVCLFCMDSNRWAGINTSMNEAKFDALDQYATSPLFTDAERAALDYVLRVYNRTCVGRNPPMDNGRKFHQKFCRCGARCNSWKTISHRTAIQEKISAWSSYEHLGSRNPASPSKRTARVYGRTCFISRVFKRREQATHFQCQVCVLWSASRISARAAGVM